MSWLPYDCLMLIIACLCIVNIHRQRAAHDREVFERRNRLYGGNL